MSRGKQSSNSFLLLDEEEMDVSEVMVSKQKSNVKSRKSRAVPRTTIIVQNQIASFTPIFQLEELWMIVLEFPPTTSLFACAVTTRSTHNMVHTHQVYLKILEREFLQFTCLDRKGIKKILGTHR